MRPRHLQVEQTTALPGVATTQTTDNQYINYSINLIHHYTGLSWLDATTSAGFVRERRDLINPRRCRRTSSPASNNPSIGTVQTNFYNQTAQRDQSLYAQEQVLTLTQRLSLTAGVTAERTTNDGDINKFYYYPRYSASYRIPAVRRLPRRAQAARRVRPVGHAAAVRRPLQPVPNDIVGGGPPWHPIRSLGAIANSQA